MGKVVANVTCPECGSRSGGKIYQDDSFFCHACRTYSKDSEKIGEGSKVTRDNTRKPSGTFFTIEEIETFPFADLSHRGIRKDICEKYGVRQSVNTMTGEPDKHFFFPSGLGGGWKRKNRHDKTDQQIYGKYRGLVGQKLAGKGKMLVITEGEEDMLSVAQMFTDYGKPNWKVVSLPNGVNYDSKKDVAVLDKEVLEQYDELCGFETIVLCFDMDKPGQATVEAFADVFAGEVKIRVISLPLKDANEMLKEGRQKEFIKAFYDAKEYRPEKME